jgi:hypothetical protein
MTTLFSMMPKTFSVLSKIISINGEILDNMDKIIAILTIIFSMNGENICHLGENHGLFTGTMLLPAAPSISDF